MGKIVPFLGRRSKGKPRSNSLAELASNVLERTQALKASVSEIEKNLLKLASAASSIEDPELHARVLTQMNAMRDKLLAASQELSEAKLAMQNLNDRYQARRARARDR